MNIISQHGCTRLSRLSRQGAAGQPSAREVRPSFMIQELPAPSEADHQPATPVAQPPASPDFACSADYKQVQMQGGLAASLPISALYAYHDWVFTRLRLLFL